MLFHKNKPEKDAGQARQIPVHLGIIMDGNGRWAKKRGMPRTAGHSEGARTFRKIYQYCYSIGIRYLTVYAFSTENWKRPKQEVDGIMDLLREYLRGIAREDEKEKEHIRVLFLGDRSQLAEDIRRMMADVERETADHVGMVLNIALNYGGRHEITTAVRKLAEQITNGFIKPSDITEERISDALDTAGQPDPDLIIRPSGEYRLSNFLIWQSAYSELVFMDVLWPDFSPKHLDAALRTYAGRVRRFGGVET